MPLTSAADLPEHPTLSKPFLSKTLTELTKHAGEMVQKEKASLWRIKHLLTRLSGDNTWIPCESVETENDFALFLDDRDRSQANILGKAAAKDEGDQVSTGTLASEDVEQSEVPIAIEDRARDVLSDNTKRASQRGVPDEDSVMASSAKEPSTLIEAKDNGTEMSTDAIN